ncbi:hypothetical protein N7492_010046 [Penicillium capsulatum]|uniref:Zn(2)-C6 fungal-type domain-containing protein n=1 Tax=Penicillium capsulatum TaxID=69766 RepID=A0A9W9HLP6_9EURO|nr:hypothetical protein N7492_010046 [Penicillium capsulatum]KAJ6112555.1 hypothetical protein N7512_007879 [Penicillium capsulatum]
MRQTLRRSCAACAKSKHSCDLFTLRCSRCIKRNVECVYANEPWRPAPATSEQDYGQFSAPVERSGPLIGGRLGSFDPFDSYPPTRLRREHVQRLIYNFLHKIAFQYYPLDLSATSNPFLVSWWPLALGDPALFHVSLQTACLDEELLARRGFQASEILMADSVALLRRKVENTSLAVQDGTMNSVITLALIEFGKGNTKIGEMHVDGVKKLVDLRGGINGVRQTSPLTARMVSWVSLLIMGYPQFDTQDDAGMGDGISPIPEWQLDQNTHNDFCNIDVDIDDDVKNVLLRLHGVFQLAQTIPFPTTRLHDLTCFVVHRLLLSVPTTGVQSTITECIRYSIILYMLIIHGPSYYSHAGMLNAMVLRLKDYLQRQESVTPTYNSLDVWCCTIGLVASADTIQYDWFLRRVRDMAQTLPLLDCDDALSHVKNALWLETAQGDTLFRCHWATVFSQPTTTESLDIACLIPQDSHS